eukprot:CAMPEP_0116889618 /NCGR_PEP_ID=MMETSP0467-20121206/155_1 /TAXON_ID=283647 /ORGANISM="Mesodinium pulex, Strain SPMC105" /LENGTH=70 /DNA_ID=CAMNT_0004556555 /DNA_START=593 /DNA_END=805 /DNA_ORIENTATION=-
MPSEDLDEISLIQNNIMDQVNAAYKIIHSELNEQDQSKLQNEVSVLVENYVYLFKVLQKQSVEKSMTPIL